MASAVRPQGKHRRRASAAARTGAVLIGAVVLSAVGYGTYSLALPLATHGHGVKTTAFGQSADSGEDLAGRVAAQSDAQRSLAEASRPRPPAQSTPSAVPSPLPQPAGGSPGPRPARPSGTPTAQPGLPAGASATPSGPPPSSQPPQPTEHPAGEQGRSPASAPAGPSAAPPSAGYVLPIAGGVITTPYGATGTLWASGRNHGCDFQAATGTDVQAVGKGTVVRAGRDGAYGNDVLVKMDDGKYTLYAQLSSVAVSAGDEVTAGQVIGRSGASGRVTGPHLHFEVRTTPDYGSDVDPVAYLRGHGAAV